VQRFRDRPALVWEEHEFTYAQLEAAVEGMAARLSNLVQDGQRVAILAPNSPALVIAMFATWRLGAVVLPLNARWREYELRGILRDGEPTILISVEAYRGYSFADLLPTLLPSLPTLRRCFLVDPLGEVQAEQNGCGVHEGEPLAVEIGALLYTSGTTGAPKGALVKHSTESEGGQQVSGFLGSTPEDVAIFVIPIAHAFGLKALMVALVSGCRVVLTEAGFSLAPLVETIRRCGGTILHGSPALFTSFLKLAPASVPGLRTGLVAGAACPPQVLEQLDRAGLRVLNLYGMTEIGSATCCRPDDSSAVRFTTVGRPLTGYELRIVGGATGEIQVRGPYVTPGYFRQSQQTADSYDGDWFRTGDIGCLDRAGNLTISGRAKEVIHVGGLNVFPAEVEGFLLTHPDVVQAAVVGVPHATMGEAVQAFVVPRSRCQLTSAALLQYARARIAGYKLPYGIHLLRELPLLASGKPDRVSLRRRLLEGQTGHDAGW
jgi:acyl-CoA synthetase (AMP-forming)/AMP-acid ligase II